MEGLVDKSMRTAGNGDMSSQLKVCPQCGERLFADMNVCYSCLYDFQDQASKSGPLMPGVAHGVTYRADEPPVPAARPASTPAPAVSPAPAAPAVPASEPDPAPAPAVPQDRTRGEGEYLRVRTDGMDVTMPVPSEGLVIGPRDDCDLVVREPCTISVCSRAAG